MSRMFNVHLWNGNIEHSTSNIQSLNQKPLTLTLSRSTGRGDHANRLGGPSFQRRLVMLVAAEAFPLKIDRPDQHGADGRKAEEPQEDEAVSVHEVQELSACPHSRHRPETDDHRIRRAE